MPMENYQNDYSFANPYISAGEQIRWRGKPESGGILLMPSDWFMIPFSIFWCGFAIFWTVTASVNAGPFGLFGIPFVAVGLYITVGRFVHAAYMRKRTAYVITNLRVIRKRGNRVDTLRGQDISQTRVTMHKNGNGTIVLQDPYAYGRGYYGRNDLSGANMGFTIENIANVAQVQQILAAMGQQPEVRV